MSVEVLSIEEQSQIVLNNALASVDPIQLAADVATIDSFLVANNINAQEDSTGLRFVINAQGSGPTPILSNPNLFEFEGRRLDGVIFQPFATSLFALNQLIIGWQVGVPRIQEGGSITLYIPSGLGFGTQGVAPDIRPNEILIFDIELLDVQ